MSRFTITSPIRSSRPIKPNLIDSRGGSALTIVEPWLFSKPIFSGYAFFSEDVITVETQACGRGPATVLGHCGDETQVVWGLTCKHFNFWYNQVGR